MKNLYEDKDGKTCAAKVAFMLTVLTCLGKIWLASYTGDVIDYNGMAVLIGASGAIYFGRNHTKAGGK